MSEPAKPRLKAGSSAALALACAIIGGHEGVRYVAYRDINNKLTVCYGSTAGVVVGKTYTRAECQAALIADAKRHAKDIGRCLPEGLPGETWAALVSAGYNMGGTVFCKSSMSKRALAHDLPGACAALSLYVFSGGKDCRVRSNRCYGIATRRVDERALCENGIRS